MKLWQDAMQTRWFKPPVWIHGDIASGNILIKDNKLAAVIDFGCTSIGDPACDLTIAWTFFKNKSRSIFIENIKLDNDTWLRAKAWAIWKASFHLCTLNDQYSSLALPYKQIITDILDENY